MATITYEDFITGLGALKVVSVVHDFGYEPPGSLSTAQLPAKWVRFPRGTMEPWTFEGGATTGILTAQIVVVVIPIAQGTYETNFILTVKMIDKLWHAIAHWDLATDDTAISALRGSLNMTAEFDIGGTKYWAVIAEVLGRGRIPNVLPTET